MSLIKIACQVRRYRPSQPVMKIAGEIFEKFKRIFQENGDMNASTIYEPPAAHQLHNSPSSPDKKSDKSRTKNVDQPSNSKQRRKYPPPMKPQTFPTALTSRPQPRRATSRVTYHPSDDEVDTDTSSEFEQSSDDDVAAGQLYSLDDQCVPEL